MENSKRNIIDGIINKQKDFIRDELNTSNDSFVNGILFPIAVKIASSTISQDLMFADPAEIDKVKNRITIENRENSINSILHNTEYTYKILEEDDEYKKLKSIGVTPMSAPTNNLMYLDFVYDKNTDQNDGR